MLPKCFNLPTRLGNLHLLSINDKAQVIEPNPHCRDISLVYYPQTMYSIFIAVSGLTWGFSIVLLLLTKSGRCNSFQRVGQVISNIVGTTHG